MEICNDSFEKRCSIDYSPRLRNLNVEVCRNIPQKNCSDKNEIEEICRSYVHEIGKPFLIGFDSALQLLIVFSLVCETLNHVVEETVPKCEQKLVEHCYDGIGGKRCHSIPQTQCKLSQQNVTKYTSPDTNVRYNSPYFCSN